MRRSKTSSSTVSPAMLRFSPIRRRRKPSRRASPLKSNFLSVMGLGLPAASLALMAAALGAAGEGPAHPANISWKPLAKASAGPGETLFEKLEVERTGIDFTYFWDPPEKFENEWLLDGSLGGGVALGDYDSDGRVDVFLTRAFGGSRLYRNLGDFRFDDVTEGAGIEDDGSWDMGAAFADIENDGDLDLFVCSYDSPNRLFINQGDGTFVERAEEAGLAFTGSSTQVAFADYDRDCDLDAYLLTWRYANPDTYGQFVKFEIVDGRRVVPEAIADAVGFMTKPDGTRVPIKVGQMDRFYRNDGEGHFSDVSEASGITGKDMGLGVVWWDYDGDGWPDLYVANDFKGPDKLYRNNRDGTFTDVIREAIPHTPWFSMGADTGDINNDGFLDFIASDMAGTSHYKQKLNMGEMDTEGWFLETAEPRQYMANAVYLHSGTGRFLEVAQLVGLNSTDWTWSPKLDDFDNDGWQDLFVSNGMTRNWFNSDLMAEQARKGGFGSAEGKRVILDSPVLRERNLAFRNTGDLRFDRVSQSWGLDHEGVSFGAATADLDGDGDLDLVVNNFEEPVSIYRNSRDNGKPARCSSSRNQQQPVMPWAPSFGSRPTGATRCAIFPPWPATFHRTIWLCTSGSETPPWLKSSRCGGRMGGRASTMVSRRAVPTPSPRMARPPEPRMGIQWNPVSAAGMVLPVSSIRRMPTTTLRTSPCCRTGCRVWDPVWLGRETTRRETLRHSWQEHLVRREAWFA